MIATIRNCPGAASNACPWLWDRLAPGDSPAARRCGGCDRPVYLCATDAETAARARARQVIARETPTDAELGSHYSEIAPGLSLPLAWGPGTPEQEEARRRRSQEQAIDDAIRNAREASRDCPGCGYPVPNYRVACRVCGAVVGRLYDENGDLVWAGRPK
jgi:hypothetical protein